MRSILPSSVISRDYDSIIAGIAGFLIIQTFARHSGIGISPDSVIYISTAGNILDHGTIRDFSGWPMMDFPAGYPFFLAAVKGLTRMDILRAGPILDGLIFGCLIFTSGWLMQRFSERSRGYKWAILTIIVLSPCLLEIYSMIWSETLFLLLILLFILTIRPYLLSPSIKRLLLPATIAAVASVTRYAGISLIIMGGGLILCVRSLGLTRKISQLALFGIIASSLFLMNLYRNHLVTGTLTGYREKAVNTLGANLYHFGTVICDWLPFINGRYDMAALTGILFIMLGIALFIRRWVRKKDFFSYQNLGTAYFIVYAVFILAIASMSRFQQLDSRLLSPLFIPWLWTFTAWIPGWINSLKPVTSDRRPLTRWIAIAVLFLAAACMQWGQVLMFRENWDGIKDAGIPGYTEDQWRQSQTMDFVRHNAEMHRPYAPLYSNAYEGIWFLTGVKSDLLPHKEFTQDIREMLHEDHFYIIWFDDSINEDLVSIDYIRRYKILAKEYKFDDGTVYLFTSK